MNLYIQLNQTSFICSHTVKLLDSANKLFFCSQFGRQPVLLDSWIGPYQGLTLQGQSRPGSDNNEGALHILQKSNIRLFTSYTGHSLWESYLFLESQSVDSRDLDDSATSWVNLNPLQTCSHCILESR